MKSMCKIIYVYMSITYTMLFFGVLISDTLYREESRILCASSVARKFVPNIFNVPTWVPWVLLAAGVVATVVIGKYFKQFSLALGISNGLLGLYTLIVYSKELRNFFPFAMSQPTVRSAFLVIGSYLIVILSLVLVPMIIFSKEDGELDALFSGR